MVVNWSYKFIIFLPFDDGGPLWKMRGEENKLVVRAVELNGGRSVLFFPESHCPYTTSNPLSWNDNVKDAAQLSTFVVMDTASTFQPHPFGTSPVHSTVNLFKAEPFLVRKCVRLVKHFHRNSEALVEESKRQEDLGFGERGMFTFIGRSDCFMALPRTIFVFHSVSLYCFRHQTKPLALQTVSTSTHNLPVELYQTLNSQRDFTELIWQIRLEY